MTPQPTKYCTQSIFSGLLRQQSSMKSVSFTVVFLLLAACGSNDQTELKTWMDKERAKTPTTIKKVEPPVSYNAVAYTLSNETHPFNSDKLKEAMLRQRDLSTNKQFQPDTNRKREQLEAFPIDTMRMVGYMYNQKDKQAAAQLLVSGVLHNVKLGQYLGTDFGRVMAVTETEIVLSERIQDSAGIWSERTSRIPLSIATKESK